MENILHYKLGGAFNTAYPVRITNNRRALITYSTYTQINIRTFRIIKVI